MECIDYFHLCKWAVKIINALEICTMETLCFIAGFIEHDEIIRLYLDDLGYTYEVKSSKSMGWTYNTFYVKTKRK